MLKIAVAFLFGVFSLTVFESLPHAYWAVGILPVILIGFKYPRSILVIAVLLGFLWALGYAHLQLHPGLDPALEGVDVEVTGQIDSIPNIFPRSARFEFLIHHSMRLDKDIQLPEKVRLSWYGKVPDLQLGEVWKLRIRLKKPWGFANPGGFDYEKWLFEQGIRATGYVRTKGDNRKLKNTGISNPAYYLRANLNEKLIQTNSKYSGIIAALVLGERGKMDADRWQVLTQTGTNHLLAISGLHIGIVSGFVYFIVLFLWKRSERLCLHVAAQRVAALVAIFAAVFYAMLAGFSIPTQRAMVMASVVFIAVFSMKSLRPWNILSIALLAVLLLDPFSVLSPGFWLSFSAVAIILFSAQRKTEKQSWWWSLVKIQCVLTIGLLPLTLVFFQHASLVSPIANLFAVPWVSFFVVPVTLVGSLLLLLSDSVGIWVLTLAEVLIDIFWSVLEVLHALPFSSWQHAVPDWALIPVTFGVLLLLAPKALPGKALGLILLSPLVFAQAVKTPADDLRLSTLDVGQGLAVVLEVGNKVLVYDSGPKFGNSFNAGEAVVVPYLRQRGFKQIDTLVISHGDKDHAGGLQGILSNIDVEHFISSKDEYDHDSKSVCIAGQQWQWGSVRFEILHPSEEIKARAKLSSNNHSCVLLVRHSAGSILLTGDIEKKIERKLVDNQANLIDIDILIAPHHGSNTSSTSAFIQATSPDYVVFATGYRNPYGFPDEKVVSRYKEFGSSLVNTSSRGMITFTVSDENGIQLQPGYREVRQRFWHSRI